MNNKLFSNVTTVKTNLEQAEKVLSNPQRLLEWVPEIDTVDQQADTFKIVRHSAALNDSEQITVERIPNKVIYHSTKGRLEYDLEFELTSTGEDTRIEESLYVGETADLHLPIKLLAPIAKRALALNLRNLANLIERVSVK